MADRTGTPPPIAFGPVLSRRLGWSLGINNVRPKTCTYACVYCQLGPTDQASRRRVAFFDSVEVVDAVVRRAEQMRRRGQRIDYATFVPDGEPTLDLGIGASIRGIRAAGLQIAVITNGSLCWDEEVRDALGQADLVSIKVDTVDEATWHRLNRPLGHLSLPAVLEGIRRFTASYRGDFVTETMLVEGVNDDMPSIARLASFVSALEPRRAYVMVPTRPPAEPWVRAPSATTVRLAADVLRAAEVPVTCLVEDLDEPFAPASDPADGFLGIVAVHPMTEAAARSYLERSGAGWPVAQRLLNEGLIVRVALDGRVSPEGLVELTQPRPRYTYDPQSQLPLHPLTLVACGRSGPAAAGTSRSSAMTAATSDPPAAKRRSEAIPRAPAAQRPRRRWRRPVPHSRPEIQERTHRTRGRGHSPLASPPPPGHRARSGSVRGAGGASAVVPTTGGAHRLLEGT